MGKIQRQELMSRERVQRHWAMWQHARAQSFEAPSAAARVAGGASRAELKRPLTAAPLAPEAQPVGVSRAQVGTALTLLLLATHLQNARGARPLAPELRGFQPDARGVTPRSADEGARVAAQVAALSADDLVARLARGRGPESSAPSAASLDAAKRAQRQAQLAHGAWR